VETVLEVSQLYQATKFKRPAHIASAVSADTQGGRTGRVLVVDDTEELRSILQRRLESERHTVVCASSGPEALHLSAEHSFDVVLLDMIMPHMDGYQTLDRLKASAATRDLPVIMISGHDDSANIARCIERGAADYLPKPFDPAILRARINACLEDRDARKPEKEYLQDVIKVVSAAVEVESGTYAIGSLASVSRRGDELGTLARIFDSMAAGIRQREQTLREQVERLSQEIAGVSEEPITDHDDAPAALSSSAAFSSRYNIERALGSGGMGTVYLAMDKEIGERVAIKTLSPESISADETAMDRFRNEIRLARQLSHRNIVRTHDLGTAGDVSFVTMEFVQATTLRSALDARGKLSVKATLAIARQLTDALACAHEKGIVHRDIKPENLLLDAKGTVKVMDFGIACLAHRVSPLTEAGMFVGTPTYMAPERLQSEKVDERSDLYSLGVVLYECITGRPPFEAKSPISFIAKVLTAAALPPIMLSPDVPLAVSAVIMRLLAKDPVHRPQSANELRETLATLA
jgi:DNA-binding response OmpR family regulator